MAKKNANVPVKKRDQTATRIVKALEETHGLLTMAAKRAGVTYRTVQRYIHDYPTVAQAVQDSKDAMLDFAEGKLMQNIKDGDNTAIIFYLKTQGKLRGYVERQEVSGLGGGPIQHQVIEELSDEQLAIIAASQIVKDNASRGGNGATAPTNGKKKPD